MLDFMLGGMSAENYEERKIGRFEKDGLFVSTVFATDTGFYETGVAHPSYNDGAIIIVEEYDSKEAAENGHKKWIEKMTAKKLPKTLTDVSSAEFNRLVGNSNRKYRAVS